LRDARRVTFHTKQEQDSRYPESLTTRRARCVTSDRSVARVRRAAETRFSLRSSSARAEHFSFTGMSDYNASLARACACQSPIAGSVSLVSFAAASSRALRVRTPRRGAAVQRSYAQPRWLISGDSTRSFCSVRPSVRPFVHSFVRSSVRCSVCTSARDGTQTRSDEAAAHRDAKLAGSARSGARLLLVFIYLSLSLFHTFSLAPTCLQCLHTRRMYRIYAAAVPSPCVIAEITSRGAAGPVHA